MLERGRRPDFHHEALGAKHGGQLRLEHLDRDLAVVLEVVREIDGGHAASPELALERLAVGECCRETVDGGCHTRLTVGAEARGYLCGCAIFGAASSNEYPAFGHFTAGFVGEKTPSGFVFHSQTCRS